MSKLRRSLVVIAGLLAVGSLALPGVSAGAGAAKAREMGLSVRPAPAADAQNARVIVKYRASAALMRAQSATGAAAGTVRPQHAATLGQRLGLPLVDGRVLGTHTQAMRSAGLSSAALAQRLAAQPEVEWVEVDQRRRHTGTVPNDPLYAASASISPASGQWYLRAPDSTTVSAINAVGAWARTTGSASITVAVLDTGVRFDHPDLGTAATGGKLYPGYDFIADVATAGDGAGRDSDASDPGDSVTAGQCGAGEPADTSSWHGTQVSGLIAAASDNSVGMAGSGRDVMVLPLRVLGKCGGWDSDIVAAMRWGAGLTTDVGTGTAVVNAHPARVLNMSLGGTGTCGRTYQDAFTELNNAGVLVVVAAGNETGVAVGTPANCSGALAVAGLRHAGTKVGYSNIGPEVAIAAPAGNCVNLSGACLYPLLTTRNLGSTTPTSNGYSDATNYSVGTSFAAPLVAGTAALMLSVDPTLTPVQIRSLLRSTARTFPSSGAADSTVTSCKAPSATEQLECYCTTTTCGAGMLDANAAVLAVVPAAIAAPTASIVASGTTPTAGTSISLNGSGSVANGGRSIASYLWAITGGGTLASFSTGATGSAVTLATTAAGTVTVQLTVTDSAGATGTSTQTITVQAASTGGGTTPTPAPSGGGGGGMSALWVALLGLATAVLWWPQRRFLRRD